MDQPVLLFVNNGDLCRSDVVECRKRTEWWNWLFAGAASAGAQAK